MSEKPLAVRRISPMLSEFSALTAALDAYQQTLYPDESNHLDSIGLYRAAGYTARGPFADYREDPFSVYMEKNVRESCEKGLP